MNHIPSPLPTTSDGWVEAEIRAKGADKAPRVTPADIEANIIGEHYFSAQDGMMSRVYSPEGARCDAKSVYHVDDPAAMLPLRLLTFCVLTLRNGFTVTGESACASPENFDAEIGRKIARENAVAKVWPLMGYALRQHLHNMEMVDAEIASEG